MKNKLREFPSKSLVAEGYGLSKTSGFRFLVNKDDGREENNIYLETELFTVIKNRNIFSSTMNNINEFLNSGYGEDVLQYG